MHRHGRAGASQTVDESRVVQLLVDAAGRRRLEEFSEPRAGVGETPARQLDLESIERGEDALGSRGFHEM